ncbi:MAG TPA: hypothetical protein VGP14_12275 [Casimicrobiaceae bacterium]|nr:hypothetical protein [Casimicrobiaceae bacterium]
MDRLPDQPLRRRRLGVKLAAVRVHGDHAMRFSCRRACVAAALVVVALIPAAEVHAAKATECTKIGICYCVNDELKATIAAKVDAFRQTIAEQRKAGKAIGYLSVPLTSAGGGNFDVNKEVAERARAAIEKRFGADYIFVLNPGTKEADLPRSSTGADYMLMWTSLLEGADGLGEFDFAYFAGPQDFARYFGFDGSNDMGKLDAYFDKRVAADPAFAKAVQGGLNKASFRKYYALRASTTVSRGAHDEWNIFRMLNEKRRANDQYGPGGQIAVLFDGVAIAPPQGEAAVSDGYVGKCQP